jgi:UDP-N-acetylglucosamine acyltransferase
MISNMKQPLAYIHPEAKIASNVTVEPFAYISKNVEIGEGTWIGPNVTILDGAKIGKNCRIFPGAVISAIPQDLKFKGEETTVEIGDSTTVRECATINRGTVAKGKTVVGNNCLIMAYVHIAHDCCIGNNVILVNSVGLAGEVDVDDFAIIGGHSAVHQFVRIGAHVMIGGGSLIRKDVPPYIKAAREPLSYVGINSIGLRRRGFENGHIQQIQEIYRVIYQKSLNISQAVQYIEKNLPATAERDEVLLFIKNSKRGIIRGGNNNGNDDVEI